MNERGIGMISNYYGGLNVKRDADKFYWSIENYTGDDWEQIPQALYDALIDFEENGLTTKEPET